MAYPHRSSPPSFANAGNGDEPRPSNEAPFAHLSFPPAFAQVQVQYADGSSSNMMPVELPGINISLRGHVATPTNLRLVPVEGGGGGGGGDLGHVPPGISKIPLGTYLRCPARGTCMWVSRQNAVSGTTILTGEDCHNEHGRCNHAGSDQQDQQVRATCERCARLRQACPAMGQNREQTPPEEEDGLAEERARPGGGSE